MPRMWPVVFAVLRLLKIRGLVMGDLSADSSSEGVERWVPTIGSTTARPPVRDTFAPAAATLVADIFQHIEDKRSQALSALREVEDQSTRGAHVLQDVSAYACVH